MGLNITAAVVGLGVSGLAAVKNLAEVGINVTGFERCNRIGGIWNYDEEPRTSALPNTIANVSKYKFCYTDFPHAEETSLFPNCAEFHDYLESYASYFHLRDSFRLSSLVTAIKRIDESNQWELAITDLKTSKTSHERFDKLVMCMGRNVSTIRPGNYRLDQFKGTVLDAHHCKRLDTIEHKRIVIVGFGATSLDIVDGLTGRGNQIYLSHRTGAYLVPRTFKGVPYDQTFNYRSFEALGRLPPVTASEHSTRTMQKLQDAAFELKPEWKLAPAPPMYAKTPLASDEFYRHLQSNAVELVSDVDTVQKDGTSVGLVDGSVLHQVDIIIISTGYWSDYTLLGPYDPSKGDDRWKDLLGLRGRPLPRIYQGIFSLDEPHSLAFLETYQFTLSATLNADLASMALAQVWIGNSQLPPHDQMVQAVEADLEAVITLAKKGPVMPHFRNGWRWGEWCSRTAGTGLAERLSDEEEKAQSFRRENPQLYSMLKDGFWTPHLFRIFDEGKRKPWGEALAEIERLNS
ncbi:flavin monooxygenase-like protein [Xylogone sp. PMI_703]|nr:flavin monooxygenase-like protein [Xylogone sp. PMI_703]